MRTRGIRQRSIGAGSRGRTKSDPSRLGEVCFILQRIRYAIERGPRHRGIANSRIGYARAEDWPGTVSTGWQSKYATGYSHIGTRHGVTRHLAARQDGNRNRWKIGSAGGPAKNIIRW